MFKPDSWDTVTDFESVFRTILEDKRNSKGSVIGIMEDSFGHIWTHFRNVSYSKWRLALGRGVILERA